MKISKTQFIMSVLLIVVFVSIIASCNSISTQTYNIETPLLNAQSSIKIVLISDLHSTIHGKDQTILIDKIKNINPDLIVLSGDIFDDEVPMTGTQLLLAGISGIAPIYYVTGNHEYWSNNIQAIMDELALYEVTILSDSYTIIEINNNEIIIAGIEDPDKRFYETTYNQNDSMENAFRELDEIQLFKILIAHRPELIENYKRFSFDLVLSGHTHGGQVRFLFINGLFAPNQGFFPKYAGGLYTHENLTHIISRGLSINPRLPRIFNPPELVVIIIEANP
ncbi:MAG: metallophosphoesterase [Treponema sp.]|jgi:predicted MPP superfamily phosphohydrolase|nr:metallophosphoesterase [Treponema sp.]